MKNKYNEKINFKKNTKIFWNIFKPYKWFGFLILLLVFLEQIAMLVDRYLIKIIVDEGTNFVSKTITLVEIQQIIFLVLLFFGILLIVKSLTVWFYTHLSNILDARLAYDLKNRFFNHIIRLSYKFHTTNKTGSLISKLIRGTSALEKIVDTLLYNFMPLLFQLLLVLITVIYFDFLSALVIFVTIVLYIMYGYLILSKQQTHRIKYNKAEDREKGTVSDVFTNIDSIKFYGKEKTISRKYTKLTDIVKANALRFWNFYKWMDFGQIIIIGLGNIFLIYVSVNSFLAGNITIGTLAFIYTTFNVVISYTTGVVYGIRRIYTSMADFQELFKYYCVENEIKDKKHAKKLIINKPTIEFKDVTFSYNKRKILTKFNLKIPANKKVAFVGETGAGKSTIIRLLYRLYDPQKGEILIDNKNIKDVLQESLRSELSIVPQECVLFDDTIYNNIRFSKPKAKRKEILKAMKFAQLDKIIKELPNKERTIVGERGVKLSGGEKQRVSIARAILANKQILVLDEATSSLDSETEHQIQQDLKKLMKGRTSIIIAHRLSTIMMADIIVVISKGKIKQIGTHKDLIKHKSIYKRLWTIQKGGYIK